ncbi:Carbon monoxide dehydrogenase large chain [Pseudooceanicola marinus]|uniref:Carbon monoxide dehydrogenase large chain n=1 Tax=Pseudooceanicola marinus TaxID=396013 RepID=A0A1X6Y4B2_9RHOB|nr:xanthine dehydrogenase family protein molybdopterin-binding subunit [Pseudooceanicola marinus]PJE33406.1 xanthine dehydrogenase family protein molybdopterin-binding subunit [Pseudooceanicola marinus]SLN10243.1 Carbon monoxide dehydrogenase large chain [Pseudooceanicola marinus]
MEKFGRSQPVKRVEDVRFVTGHGGYVDDVAPEGSLFAHIFRSPVAHGRITALDLDAAREVEGVRLVVSSADLHAAGLTGGLAASQAPNRDGSKGADVRHPLLAEDKLRFVGEAVALIVAETPEAAKDAAELIELDYDDLPVQGFLAPHVADVHENVPGNRAVDYATGDAEAVEAALAASAHVVRAEVADNRVMVVSMEPRGCYAEWQGDRVHLCFGGQGVWGAKKELAGLFGLDEGQVRVTHPDVGGGFGMKAKTYPEYVLCAFAARELGAPVRWTADRTESMLSDNGARDLTHEVALGFDADHRITAYHVKTRYNLGAYNSNFGQMIQTHLFARVLTGVYDIKAALLEAEGFYSNTTQTDAYRGAGRPEAIYLLERAMDYAARDLGLDPWELRRKNFIKGDQFPYTTATGESYDVGDFPRLLDAVAQAADRAGFAERRAASEAAGKLRGQGLCYYIESILGDPSEAAKVEFNDDDTVSIYVGTQSNGQGHETVYARFLADQTGIPMEAIRVIQGDSDRIATGGGTGGSRSVTTQSNATLAVTGAMTEAFAGFLAEKMDVDPGDVSFDDESFRIKGSNAAPTMMDVAEMAREAGRSDLLVHEEKAKLPGRSYPNGAHVAEVEVDPETGQVRLERYTVVDDFGNLINPMLAEGQVHGGVVQGVGQALMENVTYDEDGQLLTASFMDYAMPRAGDVPMIGFSTEPVPSTQNPMGMKGCGEAGTVGSMAATANAVMDALSGAGVARADMPFTPQRVWTLLREAAKDREAAA